MLHVALHYALHFRQVSEFAALIAEIDAKRAEMFRAQFELLGFDGQDLDARTRAFVAVTALEGGLGWEIPEDERGAHLRARFEFFVGK